MQNVGVENFLLEWKEAQVTEPYYWRKDHTFVSSSEMQVFFY